MDPNEEKLYEIAGTELFAKNVNLGVWTKAFSTALGDEAKTKAFYIEFRVAQLREQIAAKQAEADARERALREHIAAEPARRRAREDAAICDLLRPLRKLPIEDTDHIPSSRFDLPIASLQFPVSVQRGATAANILQLDIIDYIKRGYLKGVLQNGEWYFDLQKQIT